MKNDKIRDYIFKNFSTSEGCLKGIRTCIVYGILDFNSINTCNNDNCIICRNIERIIIDKAKSILEKDS